jgi:hypothetical protein
MSRSPRTTSSLAQQAWQFVLQYGNPVVVGTLLGAVIGLASPTVCQIALKLGASIEFFLRPSGPAATVWPKGAVTTLAVIALAALLFYGIRLFHFAQKFWRSWRAGLISGVPTTWFVVSAAAFVLFSATGRYRYLLVFASAVALMALVGRRDAQLREKARNDLQADPDRPIAESNEDLLGRGTLVAGIIRAIIVDHVPVIALTGSYGDGKTSVLNLVSKELERQQDILLVRFSTWLPMDEKTLVSTLLGSIVERLETRLFVPKIKRQFVEFTRMLFAILPGMPASIKDLLEKPSQDEQIAELKRSLSRLPLRVAVLLDDMDRMHRLELDALFKVIRGVPEFPQLSYVCAFQWEALIELLRKDASENGRENARKFLEKFFPDEFPLPHIEDALLETEFERRFYATCDQNGLLVEEEERKKFQDDFRTSWELYIKGFITNLRRLKLFVNRINRTAPVVGHEVNLKDLVLLELVRMKDPVVYEEIYRNARYFIFATWRFTTWLQIVSPDEKEARKKRDAYFEVLFKDLPRPPEGIVLSLLEELFPSVNAYLRGRDISVGVGQNSEEAERQRRIFHPDFFPRYFIQHVPQELFGEKEMSSFIAAMNGHSDMASAIGQFKKKYTDLQDLPMKRWDFLRRVRTVLDRFDGNATKATALAVADLAERFESDEVVSVEGTTARAVVLDVTKQLGNGGGAQKILEETLRRSTSDRFATEVLNDCSNKKAREIDWSTIDTNKLESVFCLRMRARYLEGSYSFFPIARSVDIMPLGRWASCGSQGREDVHSYLRREFQARPSNIGAFLVWFFPAVPIDPMIDPRTCAGSEETRDRAGVGHLSSNCPQGASFQFHAGAGTAACGESRTLSATDPGVVAALQRESRAGP